VLVFALYTNSPETRQLYERSEVLWLICPLMIYWISRLWLVASRGHLCEDPVVFAVQDRGSLFVGAVVAVLLLAATVPIP